MGRWKEVKKKLCKFSGWQILNSNLLDMSDPLSLALHTCVFCQFCRKSFSREGGGLSNHIWCNKKWKEKDRRELQTLIPCKIHASNLCPNHSMMGSE